MNIKNLNEKGKAVKSEVSKRMIGAISGALALVIGLVWNDAVKAAIDYFIPISGNTILAKFIYAGFITVVIVLVLLGLERWMGEKE